MSTWRLELAFTCLSLLSVIVALKKDGKRLAQIISRLRLRPLSDTIWAACNWVKVPKCFAAPLLYQAAPLSLFLSQKSKLLWFTQADHDVSTLCQRHVGSDPVTEKCSKHFKWISNLLCRMFALFWVLFIHHSNSCTSMSDNGSTLSIAECTLQSKRWSELILTLKVQIIRSFKTHGYF